MDMEYSNRIVIYITLHMMRIVDSLIIFCGDTKEGHWVFFGERNHSTYSYESLDYSMHNYQTC